MTTLQTLLAIAHCVLHCIALHCTHTYITRRWCVANSRPTFILSSEMVKSIFSVMLNSCTIHELLSKIKHFTSTFIARVFHDY